MLLCVRFDVDFRLASDHSGSHGWWRCLGIPAVLPVYPRVTAVSWYSTCVHTPSCSNRSRWLRLTSLRLAFSLQTETDGKDTGDWVATVQGVSYPSTVSQLNYRERWVIIWQFTDCWIDLAKKYRRSQTKRCFSLFQFVWMEKSDTVNHIAMTTFSLPTILVLDLQTQFHFLPDFKVADITTDLFSSFLDSITGDRAPVRFAALISPVNK